MMEAQVKSPNVCFFIRPDVTKYAHVFRLSCHVLKRSIHVSGLWFIVSDRNVLLNFGNTEMKNEEM